MKAIERLYQYFDQKGIKPTAFEKEIGLSNGYLSVQKKRCADMGEGILNRIIDYCQDLNPTWLLIGKEEMFKTENVTPKCNPKMSPQNDENVTPNVTPKEKDDYNPSAPKFNADFSAIDIDKTSNQPQQVCHACIEKDNTIVALWELVKSKSETIKALNETIASIKHCKQLECDQDKDVQVLKKDRL